MLSLEAKTFLHIENRYKEIKEFHNVYDLTPHPTRYNILKYTLKFISLPFIIAIQAIKFVTLDTVSLTYLNIGNTLLKKINKSIEKKIKEGSCKETDDNIPKIVEYILKKYEEKPELIEQPKFSLLQNFIIKVKKYVPFASKLINFWDNGGVKHSEEMVEKQELVEIIYKKIVSAIYMAGKNGETMETEDVKKLFPEVDFKEFEEKVELVNTEAVKIKDNNPVSLPCSQPPIILESEEVEVTTGSDDIIEIPAEPAIAIPNNTINPLVNLMMLKAVYDGINRVQQGMAEFYQEQVAIENDIEIQNALFDEFCQEQWAIEKSMKIENAPIPYYIEPHQYYGYDNALLGNNYIPQAIACC
ncbi:hypothetical protein [Rickettsia endosymbiont of Lasioglossum villosulum]|uniref:hypothetical protein n=1 Tax=Rickettsia endosymbiont of Lasioglossum villosulum TaxID=3066269 RepID=UPI003132CA50